MKIKVNGIIYDSKKTPILMEFDTEERSAICSFLGGKRVHVFYPNNGMWTSEKIEEMLVDWQSNGEEFLP